MFKRVISAMLLLLIVSLSAVGSVGCSDSLGGNAEKPLLIIGCDDYEPYNYSDADGERAGLDVDLAREACKRLGWEPVFVRIDWNKRDTLLESGTVDCLWSCYTMYGMEDKYAWVGPYMKSRQVIAVMNNSSYQTFSELNGKSVAVRVGSKAESLFLKKAEQNLSNIKVYSLKSIDDVATALRNDYVDAVAGYAATIRRALQNEGVSFRFLSQDLSHASFGIAFAKNSDPLVRKQLSDTLDQMLEDGTTKKILNHYGVDTEKALGDLKNASESAE